MTDPVHHWITFEKMARTKGRKTDRYVVLISSTNVALGEIRWFSRWRRFAFYPDEGTVYEECCLRDIAAFCQASTRTHKERRK